MMTYYRIAFQRNQEPIWQWKSTVLSELSAVFQWLRLHRALPHDLLRVFTCSSREELNKQLAQENQGQASSSVTAAQFLQERMIRSAAATPEAGVALATEHSPTESWREGNALNGQGMSFLDGRRREPENGSGGDHDCLY